MTAVLALHCALASGAAWRPLQAALPEVLVIAPDLPGHGASPDPGPDADLLAASLAVADAALPEAGAVHLIGHSYGACVALALLIKRPARVRSLTLVEPVFFAAAEAATRAAHWAEMAPFGAALDAGQPARAAELFNDLWGAIPWAAIPPVTQAALAARIHLIRQSEPGILRDSHSLLTRLPSGRPPVLLVLQHAPPPIMEAIATGLCARLPQTRIIRIGTDHMVPLTAPAPLANALGEFWAETQGE